MEGLVIEQISSFVNNVCCDLQQISLLAKNGGVEIMLHSIKAGAMAFFSPIEQDGIMEFFYVVDGELLCLRKSGSKTLRKGDYFYASSISERVEVQATVDTSILYVSTKPVYQYICGIVDELNDITRRVRVKDLYTYEHNHRLHGYTMKIAQRLNLSSDRMEKLLFAAMFHDIGKINVPDYILQKPGSLNEEEFKYIRQHPTDGKRIITDTYIKVIGDIIEQHHERLDGSGYPYGLKNGDILLEAKIIAVADSYDAMTTDRPYRKALTPQHAVNELERYVGTHYEKDVVETFKSILIEQGIIEPAAVQ